MIGKKILVGPLLFRISLLSILCFLSLIQCKDKSQVNNQTSNNLAEPGSFTLSDLPNDFQQFYKSFHEDSLYQMTHIIFPVNGLPDNANPEDFVGEDFYYTADQWILHKHFDPNLHQITFYKGADIIIEERILEKKYGLMIIRRFAKASDGWRLIYYAGLNKYKQDYKY